MSDAVSILVEQAFQARRENRLADARKYWTEAMELSRNSHQRVDLIRALKGLGQIERDLGQGDKALPLYEEAAALCREEGDPMMLAHTIRHLGDIHQDAGRLGLAEPCYHEALGFYRANERTDRLDLANAIRPLAILKEQTGEIEEGNKLWTEARELYISVNVPEGVAESSERIARLAKRL